VGAAVAGEIIFAAMFVVVARQAGNADTQTIAYMCAIAAGCGAVFSLVLGLPYANFLARAVREAEADWTMPST
jgi:hypothetical protein